MATNKLLGRSTAGTGVAEEITPGTNLTLSGGTLSAPAFATYSDMSGVATTATATTGATTITVASGTGILDGYYAAGPGIVPGTTVTSGGGTTSIVLSSAIRTSISAAPITFYDATEIVNPAVSSPGIAKAWAKWASLGGGSTVSLAATVTRISGNTLATVTTTSVDHGLITGNMLQLSSASLTADVYTVTVTGARTFTISTAASTAITNQAMTIAGKKIIAGYNVNFISTITTGQYVLNFCTPFPDNQYGIMGSTDGSGGILNGVRQDQSGNYTTAACRMTTTSDSGNYSDYYGNFVSVFR